MEAALNPVAPTQSAGPAPAPDRASSGKTPRHRPSPAPGLDARPSTSATPTSQTQAERPAPTSAAASPPGVPSTPGPGGPSSLVPHSSPIRSRVELLVPWTPETFASARDLIALTEPTLPQPPVPLVRVLSRGKPATMRAPSPGSPSRHRSPSRSRHHGRSRSRRRSQSRHCSPRRYRSYLQRRSSSRRSRYSQHRSGLSRCYRQRDSRSRSRRRSASRSTSQHRAGGRSRSQSRHRYDSRYWSLAPRSSSTSRPREPYQPRSAPPWPSQQPSVSSQADSMYALDMDRPAALFQDFPPPAGTGTHNSGASGHPGSTIKPRALSTFYHDQRHLSAGLRRPRCLALPLLRRGKTGLTSSTLSSLQDQRHW
ncbi:uncharacterized protein LOC115657657 [Gopherus evgoodei]|uniref:uncharacterized protein LOC115657657 n=1 Tax=Gopherus evgoodei TaxID=1825980 RepID=UPI0011CFB1C9|nr:uncharacterized protein LOC115657657 [Gopherus evgoodei]